MDNNQEIPLSGCVMLLQMSNKAPPGPIRLSTVMFC
jgi:hypothetical protein